MEFPVSYYPFIVFMIAYFSYYVYNSYKSLQKYKISLLQIYSYRENVDLLWLRRLVVLFSSITIIVFPTGMVSYFHFHSIVFADYLFYMTLVIFIFFLVIGIIDLVVKYSVKIIYYLAQVYTNNDLKR